MSGVVEPDSACPSCGRPIDEENIRIGDYWCETCTTGGLFGRNHTEDAEGRTAGGRSE